MHPVLRLVGIGVTSVMVAICAAWAYLAVRAFSVVTVIVAAGIAAVWLLSIRMMLTSISVTPQGMFSDRGTLLRPDIHFDRNLRRLVVVGAVSTLSCIAASLFGVLYVPLMPPDAAYAVPLIAAGVGAPLVWMWWRSASVGGLSLLLLTPDGFKFLTIASMREGSWADVTAIGDKQSNGERFWNPMVFTMTDGSTYVFEAPGIYTPRGTALVDLVRFYWRHPDQRDELVDGRALRRLRHLQDA